MSAASVIQTLSRELRMKQALRREYPKSLSAKQLMDHMGLSWRNDPVRSFTLLCISFYSLNQALIGTGWQAERSGGTPGHHYRLSPANPSRGGN